MTVRSLARELGLSPTAVSLALKNSPRVSSALRTRIQEMARTANYVPNARLSELMKEVRNSQAQTYRATLAAFSLYPAEHPWSERPYLKVLLDCATARAQHHGYQLEYFWLKQPGMTPARFARILEARGIHGVFCLGSLDPEEPFPSALNSFAVTTFAASIPSRLHRVASHFAADARLLFDELLRRGYRRPGLAMLTSGDRRTDYLYSSTFLSAQERHFPQPHIPILRQEEWHEPTFAAWFQAHQPDVVVMHQYTSYLAEVDNWLQRTRKHVPNDVGIALLDMNPNRQRYSGICQSPEQMGVTAIEMLIGRLLLRDFGPPRQPKIELVVGEWNEGSSLRPPVTAAPKKAR